MKEMKISIPGQKGYYKIRKQNDFEYVNPIEQTKQMFNGSHISFEKDLLLLNGFSAPLDWMQSFLLSRANEEWNKKLAEIKNTKFPNSLNDLLAASNKKDQIKSLKGISLTSGELIAFIFNAWEEHGYTYSQYSASHHHAGIDESKLPELIHIEDDGTITTVGQTDMTKGQQKNVVRQRKVTVSKFLDKDNSWHCFFLTFRSLRGEENYKNGHPHLHYISDKWGLTRKEVLKQLTSKKYNLPALPHVDFHTHRNPREVGGEKN